MNEAKEIERFRFAEPELATLRRRERPNGARARAAGASTTPWAYKYLSLAQEMGVKNIHLHKGPTVYPLSADALTFMMSITLPPIFPNSILLSSMSVCNVRTISVGLQRRNRIFMPGCR
jgi:hypothetical protein